MSGKEKKMAIVIAVVLAMSCIGILIFSMVNIYNSSYETSDIRDYGKYKGAFYFNPMLLPEKISTEADVKAFKYIMKADLLEDNQYLLLVCKYDDYTYKNEKERMKKIKTEYGQVTIDTNNFYFPAYVYHYQEGINNEYALIDDVNNTIYYVYIQGAYAFEGEEMYIK